MSSSSVEIARFVVFGAEGDDAARSAVHEAAPSGMPFTATYAQLCALDELLAGASADAAPAWEHHEDTSVVRPLRAGLTDALADLDPRHLRAVARLWANTPEGRSSGWNAGYAVRVLKSLHALAAEGRSLYFWSWVNPDLLLLLNRAELVAQR